MAGPESEHIYGVQLRESANDGSDFSNADADYRVLFLGEDGFLHAKDSAGSVSDPYDVTGGGGVATDSIWDAAGDLAVGSGANTAARLAIGATNGMSVRRVSGAVAWAFPPGHELAYVEFTSDVSITATSEATADTIVSAGAVSFDGSTRVKVEWWAWQAVTAASGANLQVALYDGSSSIGLISRFLDDSASRSQPYGVRLLTPSNASHTYSVRGFTGSGTAAIGAAAGGSGVGLPGWIRITVA